ncbi:MAG: DEAD/DEAH box helicase [Bifidobacteriaceae bacterium]|nr:DEAD/DEAH box helicase [Bifidobacteriaceae bacterium]
MEKASATASALRSVHAPGSVVVVRDEEWLVESIDSDGDTTWLHVRGLGELVKDTTATFSTVLDQIQAFDPAASKVVADASPRYRAARLWLESTFRKTAVPLASPEVTVSAQALADQLEYQRVAVSRALDPDTPRPRILLADAVGLGKTIEIGMILSELARRSRGDRILIVSPRHVLEQMQHEMWTRFALPFVRLDSAGIQRVRQHIPATRNPFTYYRKAIISIDTLKSDLYVHQIKRQRWDAVVIDESHNLSNTATQNNRLARTLAQMTDALILASATPHNGDAGSFAELVRLLDPTAVKPGGELIASEVERLVIRRHRHSKEVASVVGADWAERLEPKNILVPPTAAEDAIATELADVWLHPTGGANPYSGSAKALFPWTLAKAFLSSPAALRQTVANRRRTIASDRTEAGSKERAALDRLEGLADQALGQPSAKLQRLVAYLKEVGVGQTSPARAVVFAERIATLEWLLRELPKTLGMKDEAFGILHGGLADEDQMRIVAEFKQAASPLRVLLTGDVASEGVNLHAQCHHLVHYDIPWSLIRIEQRNGRIDRYGQKHSPQIATLILNPSHQRFSGDVHILTALIGREHEAHKALGDVASLMGKYSARAEADEIMKALAAGQADLSSVIKTPSQVAQSGGLAGWFAQAFGQAPRPPLVQAATEPAFRDLGLYPDQVSFLDDALHAAFINPSDPLERGGVGWQRDRQFGTAELTPPPDLAQRLDVLPQSYLKDRHVTKKLILATTARLGQSRLRAALADQSDSPWPDAHYLSPLHPVLDWAADRALACLGRGEIFAVRGSVDDPTVLLLGALTNKAGRVVATSWVTTLFPKAPADPSFALVSPWPSAFEAVSNLGLNQDRPNPGPVGGLDKLQALVPVAVAKAQAQMAQVFEAAQHDAEQRVDRWAKRADHWDDEAGALVQRREVADRRRTVQQQAELIKLMAPDRPLLRPILVVVPESWGGQG